MNQSEPSLHNVTDSYTTGDEPTAASPPDEPPCTEPQVNVEASQVEQAEGVADGTGAVAGSSVGCSSRRTDAGEVTAQAEVLSAINRLQDTFEQKILLDSSREAVISRLHAELQVHKEGLAQRILRPVLMDLIMLHDDIGKLVEAQRERIREDADANRLLKLLDGVRDDLEDLLSKYGVSPYESDAGTFDPSTQRILKTVSTTDESLSRSICQRHRKGFRFEGLVLRPELVSVWKYETTAVE